MKLNATQNIFLGREQSHPGWLFVNRRKSEERARQLLAKIGMHDFDLRRPVRLLSVAQRQMIEIAKALLGPDWMPDYVRTANAGSIERVLL